MSNVLSVIISCGAGPGLSPQLPGAWAGAAEYRDWAVGQGHRILEFSDQVGGRLSAIEIQEAITPYIEAQSLAELFIYFSGHGECWDLERDYWILSRDRPKIGDLIDVEGTVKYARKAGVPRVVMFADACRSTGEAIDLGVSSLAVPILPLRNFPKVNVTVDCFWAARPGSTALEVQFRESAARSYGVFSKVLMSVLRGEVPTAQVRSSDGKKMIVKPGQMRTHLEKTVPSAGSSISGGYAQFPDCRPESELPLSVVCEVQSLPVQIDTRLHDGTPLSGSLITVLSQSSPGSWTVVEEKSGPSAQFQLPSGLVYKSQANCRNYYFTPESPMPLFEVTGDISGCFRANPILPPGTMHLVLAKPPVPTARFAVTRVIDAVGRAHPAAPSAGVFRVSTYDPLTSRMGYELQEFTSKSEKPRAVRAVEDNADLENKIVVAASQHARRGFETKTGLTLLGFPLNQTPEVAASGKLIDSVFIDDGNWQIRANHSGGVVLRLGDDRFAPLAVFQDLVGAVRIEKAKQGLVLGDLTYAPAAHSRFDADLTILDHPNKDLLSASGRDEIDALQLVAATCARNGFIDVTIDESVELAGRMRMLKHQNPVFGVLAAWAYDQAGHTDEIVDMARWFLFMEQSVPFDVVALGRIDPKQPELLVNSFLPAESIAKVRAVSQHWFSPPWPMLTQTWTKISEDYLNVFPVLAEARRSLTPGLWTSVQGHAGRKLFDAVSQGAFEWI